MNKKKYNKYLNSADRFPYIIVAVILIIAVIFIFQFKAKYSFPFFSNTSTSAQDTVDTSYSLFISSPVDNQVFNFVNKNESVPIEIRSKEIEGLNYKLNLVINDKDIIKTFSSPPYKYDWTPPESEEYTIVANLLDDSNKIISSSNEVRFIVNYTEETTSAETTSEISSSDTLTTTSDGAPTINLRIFEGPLYSESDDICYYRIEAIVTGDPEITVLFSKDDSLGNLGPLKAQVNLTRSAPSYVLTAIAKNSAGEGADSITIYWGCGPLVKEQ